MSLTVTELAEEVRDSNRRLTQAIDHLSEKFDNLSERFDNLRIDVAKALGAMNANMGQKIDNLRVELAKELGAMNANVAKELGAMNANMGQKFDNLRVDVAKELGAVNTTIESFKGRVDAEMGFAKWAAKVVTPMVFSLCLSAVGGAWYLAKLDSRLDQVMQLTSLKEVRQAKPDSGPQGTPSPDIAPTSKGLNAAPDQSSKSN
jgi:hypothetical protein